MPYHTHPPIAWLTAWLMTRLVLAQSLSSLVLGHALGSSQGFFNRDINRMELMVARHLFDELSVAFVLEHNKVADEIEKPSLLKDSFQDNLQLGNCGGCVLNPP
jgi:hypothetical protein